MTIETVTLGGVLITGLATSLHCAGMCGLLTCGLGIGGHSSQMASIGIYHTCRLAGYLVAGLIIGGIGGAIGIRSLVPGLNLLPLLLIVLLGLIAFGMDRKLSAVPGLGKLVHKVRSRTLGFPPLLRAAVVGFCTPLLPCGPLYAMFAIAFASGTMVAGGKIMFVFGLGAIPAIWVTQVASVWMSRRFNAKQFQRGRRILAGLAMVSMVWHFGLPLAARAQNGESIFAPEPACQCDLPENGK